jgi:hypothetical protein
MSDLMQRIQALISRATHAGTGEAEARTSAHIACRLIREHGVALSLGTPKPGAPPPKRRVIYSKYASHCTGCNKAIAIGESVAWAKGAGVLCTICHGW